MSKKVKNPYRGICRRLKGFKRLIWDRIGESAQKKILKIYRTANIEKKEFFMADARPPQNKGLVPNSSYFLGFFPSQIRPVRPVSV